MHDQNTAYGIALHLDGFAVRFIFLGGILLWSNPIAKSAR